LCGKVTNGQTFGDVFINDIPSDLSNFKDYIGFGKQYYRIINQIENYLVPQDDICTEDLTVRENLLFNALLRLPKTMAYSKKEAIVNHTIKLLQLEKVQNSIVGSVEKRGISGGQRKRVNM
jgi:ABC-type multidrug transport system ATPase subunit